MKKIFKRVAAAVVAAAMGVAMMGMVAFAANVPVTSSTTDVTVAADGTAKINLNNGTNDFTKDLEVTIFFDGDVSNGFGGALFYNSETLGWTQAATWGNEGKDVNATQVSDGKFKLVYTIPANKYTATDGWIEFCVQQYWQETAPINFTGVSFSQAGAGDPETGDASHVALYVIAALAAAGVVVCATRKKAAVR